MDYSTLKASVSEWLARSDLSDTAVSMFVQLAEARISRTLRIMPMEKAYFQPLDSDAKSPVPDDYIEFKEVSLYGVSPYVPDPIGAVLYVDGDNFVIPASAISASPYPVSYRASRICRLQRTSGEELYDQLNPGRGPTRFARIGPSFCVAPAPVGQHAISGVYYARFVPLSVSVPTNFLTDYAPDLLLAATLSEASAYINNEPRTAYWTGRYGQILNELQLSDERERASGTQIVTSSGVR